MLLHTCIVSRLLNSRSQSQSIRVDHETTRFYSRRRNLKVSSTCASLRFGTDVIVEILRNKALIAATVCAAAGQLAKPFTASLLYKRDFDPKAAITAGGGFSDSVFGLAVVYAAPTMYDAQGVRREVGIHARALNEVSTKKQMNTYASSDPNRSIESSSKKLLSSSESDNNSLMLEKRVNLLTDDIENYGTISGQLKESIGHTEIELSAGALLGVLASLAVYSI